MDVVYAIYPTARRLHLVLILVTALVLLSSVLLKTFQSGTEKSENIFLEKLQVFDIPATGVRSTYAYDRDDEYAAIATAHHKQALPDTTVVILNWSRLSNVILIASLLCGYWLEDIVAQIIVWNNNAETTLTHLVSNKMIDGYV